MVATFVALAIIAWDLLSFQKNLVVNPGALELNEGVLIHVRRNGKTVHYQWPHVSPMAYRYGVRKGQVRFGHAFRGISVNDGLDHFW